MPRVELKDYAAAGAAITDWADILPVTPWRLRVVDPTLLRWAHVALECLRLAEDEAASETNCQHVDQNLPDLYGELLRLADSGMINHGPRALIAAAAALGSAAAAVESRMNPTLAHRTHPAWHITLAALSREHQEQAGLAAALALEAAYTGTRGHQPWAATIHTPTNR
jgi:hypothetical protein